MFTHRLIDLRRTLRGCLSWPALLLSLTAVGMAGCASRAAAPVPEPAAPRSATLVARAADDADEGGEHPSPDYPRAATRAGMEPRVRDVLAARTPGKIWYGLLHAHTCYSDGTGTPAEAFARAEAKGLDFFAVTEHNHDQAELGAGGSRQDGVTLTQELYADPGDVTVTRHWEENGQQHTQTITSPSLIAAATQASNAQFVALYGQEFSSISKGNHINVIAWEDRLTVPNGDFRGLYDLLTPAPGTPASGAVLQLNHPDVQKDLFYQGTNSSTLNAMENDYGFDDYGKNFAQLVAAAGPHARLIEVFSGPALSPQLHPTFHYPDAHDDDYYYYLSQGFHLSPSVGQDNHFITWGDATPARTGVYATSLTSAALLAAMRGNRTFATEDADLRFGFTINDKPMGSTLDGQAGTTLHVAVQLEDPTDSQTEYVVELYHGTIAPQGQQQLEKLSVKDGLLESWEFTGDGDLALDDKQASGGPEFFFVRVVQQDGDRAWSAPIWLNHARTEPGA